MTVDDVLLHAVHEGGVDGITRFGAVSMVIGYWVRMARNSRTSWNDAVSQVRAYNQAQLRPPWPDDRLLTEFIRIKELDEKNKVDLSRLMGGTHSDNGFDETPQQRPDDKAETPPPKEPDSQPDAKAPPPEDILGVFDKKEKARIESICVRMREDYKDHAFSLNNKKAIKPSDPGNITLAIHRLGVFLRVDLFNDRYEIHGLPGHGPVMGDPALRALQYIIFQTFSFMPMKSAFQETVFYLAYQNRFHPVRDYFRCLKWDGTPRLDKLFRHYFDAKPLPYLEALSSGFLILAVRRIHQPFKARKEMTRATP